MKYFLLISFFCFASNLQYTEDFSCSATSVEISQKTNNYIDKSQPIDNKYKLLKKEIYNNVDLYERWLARDEKTGVYCHIKVFF